MREVNLRDMTERVSPKYFDVPQPMKILHSKEEFRKRVMERENSYVLIENMKDFHEFMSARDLFRYGLYANVTKLNVWIATGETFIPEEFTDKDVIMWKLDEMGKPISTDNCFIQLHIIYALRGSYLAFCSSGVFRISINNWDFSAAVKPQFLRAMTYNPGQLGSRRNYDHNLQKLLNRKAQTVRNTRLFYLLFSKESPYFLKPDAAIKAVYGNSIRTADFKKLLNSAQLHTTFLREMEFLMPELKKAFQEKITDVQMVEMALGIFKKAQDDGTVDDSLKAYDLIMNLREEDYGKEIPLVGIGAKTPSSSAKLISPGTKTFHPTIEIFDEEPAQVTKKSPPEKSGEGDEFASEEELLNFLREDTGALDTVNRKDAL